MTSVASVSEADGVVGVLQGCRTHAVGLQIQPAVLAGTGQQHEITLTKTRYSSRVAPVQDILPANARQRVHHQGFTQVGNGPRRFHPRSRTFEQFENFGVMDHDPRLAQDLQARIMDGPDLRAGQ